MPRKQRPKRTAIQVRLDQSIIDRLARIGVDEGRTVSEVVREAIALGLDRRANP